MKGLLYGALSQAVQRQEDNRRQKMMEAGMQKKFELETAVKEELEKRRKKEWNDAVKAMADEYEKTKPQQGTHLQPVPPGMPGASPMQLIPGMSTVATPFERPGTPESEAVAGMAPHAALAPDAFSAFLKAMELERDGKGGVSVSWQKTDEGLIPLPTKMTDAQIKGQQPIKVPGDDEEYFLKEDAKTGKYVLIHKTTGVVKQTDAEFPEKGPLVETSVTVNEKGDLVADLDKETRKKTIQELMFEVDPQLRTFDRIDELWTPTFSTMGFQIHAGLRNFVRRIDSQTLDSAINFAFPSTKGQDTKFRQFYQWAFEARISFLKMRKWITGVAGGEKEMKDIELALPNLGDGAERYRAKQDEWRVIIENTRDALENALVSGRKFYSDLGLDPNQFTADMIPVEKRKDIIRRAQFEAEQKAQERAAPPSQLTGKNTDFRELNPEQLEGAAKDIWRKVHGLNAQQ